MDDTVMVQFRKILAKESLLDEREETRKNILNFLKKSPEYLAHFPQVFCFRDENEHDEQSNVQKKKEFSYWLHQRLSFFWTLEPEFADGALKVQEYHLDMLQHREPEHFVHLVSKYLDMMGECLEKSNSLFHSVELQEARMDTWSSDHSGLVISFDDGDDLEVFQIYLTKLLSTVTDGLNSNSKSLVQVVFQMLCQQIECGDMELKCVSLAVLRKLFISHGWPGLKISSQISNVVFSLLRYLESQDESYPEAQNEVNLFLRSVLSDEQKRPNEEELSPFFCELEVYYKLKMAPQIDFDIKLPKLLQRTLSECLKFYLEQVNTPRIPLSSLSIYLSDRMSSENVGALEGLVWHEIRDHVNQQFEQEAIPTTTKTLATEMLDLREKSPTWERLSSGLSVVLSTVENTLPQTKRVCVVAKKLVQRIAALDDQDVIHIDFLPRSTVSQIIQQLIQHIIQNPNEGNLFYLADSIISDILYFQPLETLTQQLLNQCIAIATMPWMNGEVKFQDLRLTERVMLGLGKASSTLQAEFKEEFVHSVIFTVSSVQKEVAPMWRIYVLRKAWNCGNDTIKHHIVNQLPVILHCLGQCTMPLVREITGKILADGKAEEIAALSGIVGKLVCVLSKQGYLLKIMDKMDIQCLKCDRLKKIRSNSETPLKEKDLEFLFKLVGFQDSQAKSGILGLLEPLSNHVGFSAPAVRLWLNYFEKTEEQHFSVFLKRVKCLLVPEHFSGKKTTGTVLSRDITQLEGWEDHVEVCDVVMNSVTELCEKAKGSKHLFFIDLVCMLLTDLSGLELDKVQCKAVQLMVRLMLNVNCHVQMFIHCGEFFRCNSASHKKLIMFEVSQALCESKSKKEVLDSATVMLAYQNSKTFLVHNLHHLLPNLTLWCAQNKNDVPLEYLAEELEEKVRFLLAANVQYIMPFLVSHTDTSAAYKTCQTYLETQTNLKLSELVKSNRQFIINELMLSLESHHSRVMKALVWLAENDNDFKSARKNKGQVSKAELVEYIGPRFLGVLGFCEHKLNNANITNKGKCEVLSALVHMMDFMGPRGLASVKHKLLATFKSTMNLKLEGQELLTFELWNKFVRTLDTQSLQPILPEILANAYILLDRGFARAVEIFNFLLIDLGAKLNGAFSKLNFIPDHVELEEIQAKIRSANKITGNTLFADILKLVTNSLSCDSAQVKMLTLKKLKQLLRLNQGKVQGLMMSSDQVDPVINLLMENLMAQSKDSDQSVTLLVGQCLGFLGAVDPGRLEQNQDFTAHTLRHSLSLQDEDEKFPLQLLKILIRAFLNSVETTDSDACAFSIQEVMKCFKVKEKTSLWKLFSDNEKEILTPFATSLYSRTERVSDVKLPIFKSRVNMTFHEWISNFSCHLVGKVNSKKEQEVFYACKAAMKKDTDVCEFLLPYIIGCLIDSMSTKIVNDVLDEINAVLESINSNSEHISHDLERKASQVVFSIVDHLKLCMRQRHKELEPNCKRNMSIEKLKAKDLKYTAMEDFMAKMGHKKLGIAALKCNSYARALMHLESDIKSRPEQLPSSLGHLQHISGALQEVDYVVGLESLRESEPSLEERLFYLKSTRKYQDVLGCYEGQSKSGIQTPSVLKSVLECYLMLDCPHTAATLVHGYTMKEPDLKEDLKAFEMEAAWELGQWDIIEPKKNELETDKVKVPRSWPENLATSLYYLNSGERSNLHSLLNEMTSSTVGLISGAAMEEQAYQKSYGNVVKLQILNEIHQVSTLLLSHHHESDDVAELFDAWKTRQNFAQSSIDTLDTILRVRRGLLKIMLHRFPEQSPSRNMVRTELNSCLISSAQVARKSGQYNKAFNILVEVPESGNVMLFLEKARLKWARGEPDEAIQILKKGIKENFAWYNEGGDVNKSKENKLGIEVLATSKLLLARYIDEAANLDAEKVPKLYQEARQLAPESEEAFFHIARFFDKILGKNYKSTDLDVKGEIVTNVISNYVKSLLYGCSYIDQSLPRMLSLWLDYGERVWSILKDRGSNSKSAADMASCLKKINHCMQTFAAKCPTYYFLVAFPQLTSRICHPQVETWGVLKTILTQTFVAYPNQVFWHMVSLSQSSVLLRRQRCDEIFGTKTTGRSGNNLPHLVACGKRLAGYLHDLAEKKTSVGQVSLDEVLPELKVLIEKSGFAKITIPTTRNMTTLLPSDEVYSQIEVSQHDPLPQNAAAFWKVEDKVVVMRSLVTPKKVCFIGTDGKKYSFLCKPKDDLRRDCRLIDFNNLLNKLFKKDPACRKRGLRIRTYKVIPVNETSGIIEWVDNLDALRNILSKFYKEKFGENPIQRHEYEKFATKLGDQEGNRRNFDTLVKRHPLVFSEWFKVKFPDPQTWFLARLGYTRTTAVMSMVGYLLGLGDRHAENVMFDSSNGDTVHVDLNCIFNKGETLKIPEIVPFRLTRNMVEAMGPTGYEGPFRIACEKSLGLMRREKDLLISSLRPFLFDPLVDWVKSADKQKTSSTNEMAMESLKAIERRLEGIISKRKTKSSDYILPLSVSGQVDLLINEATSEQNLSQMFLGWSSYL